MRITAWLLLQTRKEEHTKAGLEQVIRMSRIMRKSAPVKKLIYISSSLLEEGENESH